MARPGIKRDPLLPPSGPLAILSSTCGLWSNTDAAGLKVEEITKSAPKKK